MLLSELAKKCPVQCSYRELILKKGLRANTLAIPFFPLSSGAEKSLASRIHRAALLTPNNLRIICKGTCNFLGNSLQVNPKDLSFPLLYLMLRTRPNYSMLEV